MKYYRFFYFGVAPAATGWYSYVSSCLFPNRRIFEWFLKYWSRNGWLYEERPCDKILNDKMIPMDFVESEVLFGEQAYFEISPVSLQWLKVSPVDQLARSVVCGWRDKVAPIVSLDFRNDSGAAVSALRHKFGPELGDIAKEFFGI